MQKNNLGLKAAQGNLLVGRQYQITHLSPLNHIGDEVRPSIPRTKSS